MGRSVVAGAGAAAHADGAVRVGSAPFATLSMASHLWRHRIGAHVRNDKVAVVVCIAGQSTRLVQTTIRVEMPNSMATMIQMPVG